MPVSMIHTQHSSNYPHYGFSLAPSPDIPTSYTISPAPQASKNSPSLLPSSSPSTGYISTSKDDTTHRFHLPLNPHDAHHNTENYPTKIQYDSHVTTLKHTTNQDLDVPPLNGNYHPSHTTFPLYNIGPTSGNAPATTNHPHHSHNNVNYSHSQAHENGHSTNYPTMTSFTNSSQSLINSPSLPPHLQLATENVVSSHSSSHATTTSTQSSQSFNDSNGMDKRSWPNHSRNWTPQPTLSSPPSSPNKSPATPPSVGPQPITASSTPSESTRNNNFPPHPTRSTTRPNHPTQQHNHPASLPKIRPSLPSPSAPSPPSSPASNTSSSPPSSPRGTKRRRSDQERREKHNDTERKGRQKINSEIRVLKSLLPELQNSAAPKVSVLQCAVDTIKRRTEYATTMQQQNAHLRDENKNLKAEIARLQHLLGMTAPNQALPLHLPPPSGPPVPIHHSSVGMHPPLDTLDHNKRHDGYAFPGLAPSLSASSMYRC